MITIIINNNNYNSNILEYFRIFYFNKFPIFLSDVDIIKFLLHLYILLQIIVVNAIFKTYFSILNSVN